MSVTPFVGEEARGVERQIRLSGGEVELVIGQTSSH